MLTISTVLPTFIALLLFTSTDILSSRSPDGIHPSNRYISNHNLKAAESKKTALGKISTILGGRSTNSHSSITRTPDYSNNSSRADGFLQHFEAELPVTGKFLWPISVFSLNPQGYSVNTTGLTTILKGISEPICRASSLWTPHAPLTSGYTFSGTTIQIDNSCVENCEAAMGNNALSGSSPPPQARAGEVSTYSLPLKSMQTLYLLTGADTGTSTATDDISGDGRLGLAEAIAVLELSQRGRGMKMWKAASASDFNNGWGTHQVIGTEDKELAVIDDLMQYGVKRLYASYDKTYEEISGWNQKLFNAGIESYLTLGNSTFDIAIYPENRNLLLDAIDVHLIAFNNNYANSESERFKGIRLNLEPQRMEAWENGNPEEKRQLLLHLLDTFHTVRSHLDLNNGSTLKIFADIGHYFDKLPSPDPANGKVGWISIEERDQWFSDLSQVLDTVIIMSYGLTESSIETTTAFERDVMTNTELALNIKDIASIGTGEDIWQDLDGFVQTMRQVETNLAVCTTIHSYRYLQYLDSD